MSPPSQFRTSGSPLSQRSILAHFARYPCCGHCRYCRYLLAHVLLRDAALRAMSPPSQFQTSGSPLSPPSQRSILAHFARYPCCGYCRYCRSLLAHVLLWDAAIQPVSSCPSLCRQNRSPSLERELPIAHLDRSPRCLRSLRRHCSTCCPVQGARGEGKSNAKRRLPAGVWQLVSCWQQSQTRCLYCSRRTPSRSSPNLTARH
jgi:hypothetical protein